MTRSRTHLGTSSITSGSKANSSSMLSRSARPLPLASINALSHVESTLSKYEKISLKQFRAMEELIKVTFHLKTFYQTHFNLLFDPISPSLHSLVGLSSGDSIEFRIVFSLNSTSVLSVLKSSQSFRSCSISLRMSVIS